MKILCCRTLSFPEFLCKAFALLVIVGFMPCLAAGAGEAIGPWKRLPPTGLQAGIIEVEFDDHKITYERVPTPRLLPRPLPPKESLGQQQSMGSFEAAAPDEGVADAVYSLNLHLTCTEIEGTGLTEVRWHREEGEVVFWSTIDFRILDSHTEFSSPSASFFFFIFHFTISPDEIASHNASVISNGWPRSSLTRQPLASKLTSGTGKARFLIVPASKGVALEPDAAGIITDIHRIYDEQRDELVATFARRQAEYAAHERWLAAHPPKPTDSHIRFFPIRSGGQDFSNGNIQKQQAPQWEVEAK